MFIVLHVQFSFTGLTRLQTTQVGSNGNASQISGPSLGSSGLYRTGRRTPSPRPSIGNGNMLEKSKL